MTELLTRGKNSWAPKRIVLGPIAEITLPSYPWGQCSTPLRRELWAAAVWPTRGDGRRVWEVGVEV